MLESKKLEQKIFSWEAVWSEKNINYELEKSFFDIFITDIHEYIDVKNKSQENLIVGLLNSYFANVENRSYQFMSIIDDSVYLEFFKLHFKTWDKKFNDKTSNSLRYSRIIIILDNILYQYQEKSLNKGDSFSFF